MPLKPPPDPARGRPQPDGPRRRSMVAGTLGTLTPLGALTALTAGCSDDGTRADAEQQAATEKRLRREAARESLELLARYDATADTHTSLADRLRPLRASTMQHAEMLSGEGENKGGDRDGRRRRPGDDGGSLKPDGKHRRPHVPGTEQAALAALGDAERRTAKSRTKALVEAPPETARLLASVAAAGAAHAYLLGTRDTDGKGDGT